MWDRCRICILIFICLLSPLRVQAEAYLKPALMYLERSSETDGVRTTNQRTLLDLQGGYSFGNGVSLGLLYGTEREKVRVRSEVWTTESDASRTSLGPGLGWISREGWGGPFVHGTWFFSSEYESDGQTFKGNGVQIDMGFRFAVKRAYLALQASYKAFRYEKYTSGTSTYELSSPLKHSFVDPYFSMFFEF